MNIFLYSIMNPHFFSTPCQSAFRALLMILILGAPSLRSGAFANTADFNSPGDPSHGKADLLFQNKTTGSLKVWFMNGASYTREKTITLNGSPWPVTDWQYVGVGKFQPNPNVPAIVWQHPVTRQMAVWWMKNDGTGDLTAIDTTSLFYGGYAPVGWRAVAVGDFDGVKGSDIALQHDTTGQVAIWLMDNGINVMLSGTLIGNDPKWRVTGTGDFGAGGAPDSGVKDGKADLLLTFYDPVNDSAPPVPNRGGIWFMNGASKVPKVVQKISNGVHYDLPTGSPDWRLLATGDFDGDEKTDTLIRDAVIGRHGLWYLSGHIVQSGAFIKPEPDPAWKLYSQDWLQSTWRHKNVYSSIGATALPGPGFTLNYRIAPSPSESVGVTIKRRIGTGSWEPPLVTGYLSSSYTDTSASLQAGVRYEYEVSRDGISGIDPRYMARVFACLNQPVSVMENRGKILVIVDNEVSSGIATALDTFYKDLVGDGWSYVEKTDAPRHDDRWLPCGNYYKTDPAADDVNKTGRDAVKTFIDGHPDAKGIILIGHVTIPYSGRAAIDGHVWPQHEGAWVCDAWYGHSGNGWTDTTNHVSASGGQSLACTGQPFNSNVAGDGKFDQDFIP